MSRPGAWAAGFVSQRAGDTHNPHPPGSVFASAWAKGWRAALDTYGPREPAEEAPAAVAAVAAPRAKRAGLLGRLLGR